MVSKDFSGWHALKSRLQRENRQIYFYEGEIWWASIGQNLGDEEDGKGPDYSRPVLIVRVFNRNLFYGIPLSTKIKSGKYYLNFRDSAGNQQSALLTHMREYSSKRLIKRLSSINMYDCSRVRRELCGIIMNTKP